MPTTVLRQAAPAPKCGTRNVYSGVVLSQAMAATRRAAKAAAKLQATNAATPLLNADRAKRCPAICPLVPPVIRGNNVPLSKEVLTTKIIQSNRWISYYTARWRVVILCPAAPRKKKKRQKKRAMAGNNENREIK